MGEWSFAVSSEGFGNPVPYKRTTQATAKRMGWAKDDTTLNYKKYLNWKKHVRSCFIDAFDEPPENIFKKNTKYYVNVMIYFKDKKGGDPDNIGKGVKDAIFAKPLNDKFCSDSNDYSFEELDNPRVEITIREA